MNKGKVVDINKNYAIVLNDNLSYEKIKIKGKLEVGKNIYYFEEDKYTENKVFIKKYFLVAALFFMMLFIQPLINIDEVYGYISLDINPSIQLEINKDFEILDINAINNDAKSIINEEWIGKDVKFVIDEIIDETERQGILNEDRDFVLVSYYLPENDKEIEDKLIKDFDEIFDEDENDYEVAIIKSHNEDLKEAQEEENTIGRIIVNNKMKKKVSDLMDVKEKIEEDRDFKIYKKRVKNNKGKSDNKKEIKDKEYKEEKEIKNKEKENKKEIKINNKNKEKNIKPKKLEKEQKNIDDKDYNKVKDNNKNKDKEEIKENKEKVKNDKKIKKNYIKKEDIIDRIEKEKENKYNKEEKNKDKKNNNNKTKKNKNNKK